MGAGGNEVVGLFYLEVKYWLASVVELLRICRFTAAVTHQRERPGFVFAVAEIRNGKATY